MNSNRELTDRTTVYLLHTVSTRSRTKTGGAARQRGVTMFELLVVMMIMGILAAIGIPTYRYVTTSSRMSSQLNALLGDLQYARSEAIREGEDVTVCVAATTTSPYTCAGTGTTTWQNGWLVFSDPSDSHTYSGTHPLRVSTPFTQGDTFTADNNVNYVTFNREGFAYTGVSTVTITLHDSSDNSAYTRCLYISESGMMSTAMHSTDASCQ